MTRVFDATCENFIVEVDGVEVDAEILTQGKAASSGIVVINQDVVKYISMNTTDLVLTLEKMSDVLGTIASTLTSIGAGMLGSMTAPPPGLGASVSAINEVASELNTLKVNLK